MEDKYDFYKTLNSWVKCLKEHREEQEEYKAVFIDLEDFENSINKAGGCSWFGSRLKCDFSRSFSILSSDIYTELNELDMSSLATILERSTVNRYNSFNTFYGWDFESGF